MHGQFNEKLQRASKVEIIMASYILHIFTSILHILHNFKPIRTCFLKYCIYFSGRFYLCSCSHSVHVCFILLVCEHNKWLINLKDLPKWLTSLYKMELSMQWLGVYQRYEKQGAQPTLSIPHLEVDVRISVEMNTPWHWIPMWLEIGLSNLIAIAPESF